MKPERLGAFTDGVIAIIITITVLELPVPHDAHWPALRAEVPILMAYLLSFVNVGIYWANHHHMLAATEQVDGRVLWANLAMLFGLSLAPWVIRWIDEVGFASLPVAAYGVVFSLAAIGYLATEREIVRVNGPGSAVQQAVGADRKARLSSLLYLLAVPLAFVAPLLAIAIYVAIAVVWLAPDRRIERQLRG